MTPKQKAEELVDKFIKVPLSLYIILKENEHMFSLSSKEAKQCALIAVNEMIVQNGELYLNQLGKKALQFYIKNNHFLFEVKKEIENM
jgi:hypothetical protein